MLLIMRAALPARRLAVMARGRQLLRLPRFLRLLASQVCAVSFAVCGVAFAARERLSATWAFCPSPSCYVVSERLFVYFLPAQTPVIFFRALVKQKSKKVQKKPSQRRPLPHRRHRHRRRERETRLTMTQGCGRQISLALCASATIAPEICCAACPVATFTTPRYANGVD